MRLSMSNITTYKSESEMRAAYAAIRATFYKPAEPEKGVIVEVPVVEQEPEPKGKSLATIIRYKHPDGRQSAAETEITELPNFLNLKHPGIPEGAFRYPPVDLIIMAACAHFNFTKPEMLSERRHVPLIRARHIAMYLCRKLTVRSHPYIGKAFGDRDHTTVLSAVKKVTKLATDPSWMKDIEAVESLILSAHENKG
jgi:hypothetical protein